MIIFMELEWFEGFILYPNKVSTNHDINIIKDYIQKPISQIRCTIEKMMLAQE